MSKLIVMGVTEPIHRGRAKQAAWLGLDEMPLAGKAVLVLEDELIALNVESELEDAGASVVKSVSSVAEAQSAIDGGTPFDAAVIDLRVAEGDARPLIQALSEQGIPVVVTTDGIIEGDVSHFRQAVAILQKPYALDELIEVMAWIIKQGTDDGASPQFSIEQ